MKAHTTYQCDICGCVIDSDQNENGITDKNGSHLIMCGLHAETSKIVSVDCCIDAKIMRLSTLRLNRLRPSLANEPEKWVDWDPLNTLIKLYKDVQQGKDEEITVQEKAAPVEPVQMKIKIPGDKVRAVSENKLIEKELLRILSYCTGRQLITDKPESQLIYDEFSNPEKRIERYGNKIYGLSMEGRPLQSGVGVHGEESEWNLHGLPEGIQISAQSRLDMRGGEGNYFTLKINGSSSNLLELIKYIESTFAQEIKK